MATGREQNFEEAEKSERGHTSESSTLEPTSKSRPGERESDLNMSLSWLIIDFDEGVVKLAILIIFK